MPFQKFLSIPVGFLVISLIFSCKSGPFNLLKSGTPHQVYERNLKSAGLAQTAMGTKWIANAQLSLQKALPVSLPFQEKGYFSADKVEAIAYKFQLTRGQKLQVALERKPADGFMIYLDVWQPDGANYKLIAATDTLGTAIKLDVDQTGTYIIRLQPELLGSGSYTLAATTGASLNFPIKAASRNAIKSLWGVGRDNGARKHEGIDIFASFRTPVLAVAPGTVTRVNTNNLGGKVVWLRPDGKDYTLYYAHLDEQTVSDGQTVALGDTLGRMGSTGNAQGGPPHLHFGIYASGGAVDPLPFVDPSEQTLPKVVSAITALNTTMRTSQKAVLLADNEQIPLTAGTILRIGGANGNSYRVELPNGDIGFVNSNRLISTQKPLSKYKVAKSEEPVFDLPDSAAAIKLNLKTGDIVDVLGSFGEYQLMLNADNQTGWIKR